jgi:hypothetical protein
MDPNISAESSNKFFDEVRFTEVESGIDGQKCFSLTLLIEKASSYLLGDTGEEKDILSLFKMKFLANEVGSGEVTLLANKSQMVGENVNSDNKEIELIDSSLKPVLVKITDSGVIIPPPSVGSCNTCKETPGKGLKQYGDANCDGQIDNIDISIFFYEKFEIEDDTHVWDADFNCVDEISRPNNLDYAVWVNSCYKENRCVF